MCVPALFWQLCSRVLGRLVLCLAQLSGTLQMIFCTAGSASDDEQGEHDDLEVKEIVSAQFLRTACVKDSTSSTVTTTSL